MPSSVRRDGEDRSLITYRYLSDGTKVSAEAVLQPEIDEGDGYTPARIYRRRYKGSFTYVTDPDTGEERLESIAWKEGMIFLRRMAETSEFMDTLAVLDAGNRIIYDRWYVKDHLGNVRTVVELGSHVGEIVEQDDYLPFGTRFTPATQGVICTMDTELYGCEHDNRYRYAGKEEQRFGHQIDLALLDFGARSYDPFTARWTSIDPLAHKYLGMSPYNYCSGNPVMYFDPDGRDWYIAEDSSIKWTDYKSQEEMNENNIAGQYLGARVVVFAGSYDEKLGKGDNIYGEGAKTASVDVYGARGADDISHYTGFTMTSDFEKFGAIADGEYDVMYNPSKNKKAKIPKIYSVNNGDAVDCVNGINPSPAAYDPYSPTQKNGIYVHRTNHNGWAGDNPEESRCVSSGCLLIGAREWDSFYNQIGNNGFKLILKRK